MKATELRERLVTAEEIAKKPPRYACELVEGRIVRLSPAGGRHGVVIGRINRVVSRFVDRKKLGLVTSGETGFFVRRDPDTVRAPDLAFVSHATIARFEKADETFFPGAPDLAIEVLSPDDSWEAVEKKVGEYLSAGSKLVWVVSPEAEKVYVYEPENEGRVLGRGDRVDGGAALPGFRAPVKAFFHG
jgi:Uma2 family endonuclease